MSRSKSLGDRLLDHANAWGVIIDDSFETPSSLIAYGYRGARPVVLKVVKNQGDEWQAGEVLSVFDGRGTVRIYEQTGGAMLLERLIPGNSLVDFAVNGRDVEATTILASVIGAMGSVPAVPASATVQDWGKGFDSYLASGGRQIPANLVTRAQEVFGRLDDSETHTHLLHGDLQHSNVLFDENRGWLAIDPKGVVGETEYEAGAALRNPAEDPSLFTDPAVIERRVNQFSSELGVDRGRVLGWAFAQAVLSAIWTIEDGGALGNPDSTLLLARTIWSMM